MCSCDGFCVEHVTACEASEDCGGSPLVCVNELCQELCDGDDDCSGSDDRCDIFTGFCRPCHLGDECCPARTCCSYEGSVCTTFPFPDCDSDWVFASGAECARECPLRRPVPRDVSPPCTAAGQEECCGNEVVEAGESCDPPGTFCTASCVRITGNYVLVAFGGLFLLLLVVAAIISCCYCIPGCALYRECDYAPAQTRLGGPLKMK